LQRITKIVVVLLLFWSGGSLGAFDAMAADGQININTAGGKEFEELPFIGAAKAKAIVRYRQKKGRFTSVDELRQVPEIGEETFQAIKPYLTLSGGSTFSVGKPEQTATGVASAPLPAIITQPGEVRLLTDQEYYPILQSLIGRATASIDVAMFLFKTTDASNNRAASLVQDLINASKRGVIVNVLLEKSGYDPKLNSENQKVGAYLKKQGVKVRFDAEKTTTHAKIVVIDRRYCLVGSHNFTGSALTYNHEASLLVDNQSLANELRDYIRGIQ